MWIKISDTLYVNSDQVQALRLKPAWAVLYFNNSDLAAFPEPGKPLRGMMPIDLAAASYFLLEVEAHASMMVSQTDPVLSSDVSAALADRLYANPLQSQLAQALRYDFPQGASLNEFSKQFPNVRLSELERTLTKLIAEKVVIFTGTAYFHASNPAPTGLSGWEQDPPALSLFDSIQSPDPSTSTEGKS